MEGYENKRVSALHSQLSVEQTAAHKMGEKFISHNSERGLTSIIHNELNQLNTKKKKKTAIQKRGYLNEQMGLKRRNSVQYP